MKANYTAEQLVDSAQAALERELGGEDVIEPGFKPLDYWSKLWGHPKLYCRIILLKHVKSGRMACKKFKIKLDRQKRSVSHWKAIR